MVIIFTKDENKTTTARLVVITSLIYINLRFDYKKINSHNIENSQKILTLEIFCFFQKPNVTCLSFV